MSQRIHSCDNNINLETIRCDAYTARLRNERPAHPSPARAARGRERSVSSNRLNAPMGNLVASKRAVGLRQTTTLPHKHTNDHFQHKECYNSDNNAMVEVTVKTHNRPNSRSTTVPSQGPKKDTWGRMLKSSYEGVPSSFTNFDPLRTIHFLTNELQYKLHNILPNDKNVQQMIFDMQQALSRVPPDASNTRAFPKVNYNNQFAKVKLKTDMKPTKLEAIGTSTELIPKTIQVLKVGTYEKSSQTVRELYVEPEKLQQHLEESSEKIEKACQQMEQLCSKLKCEKEELEIKLRSERNCVKILQKQIQDDANKCNTANALVNTLKLSNDDLELEIKKLHIQLANSNQGKSAEDLRKLIHDLSKQKIDAEEECMLLKQQMTLAHMETEKYEAILSARDTQIKEIRFEMSQLQEVVNEQLMELQNNYVSSEASSVSVITAQSSDTKSVAPAALLSNRSDELNQEFTAKVQKFYENNSKFASLIKEVTSGNSSATSTELLERQKIGDGKSIKQLTHKKVNQKNSKGDSDLQSDTILQLRDKFVDIKNQALAINSKTKSKC